MKAKTIKRARERRGETPTQAAAAVGVSERTWYLWEERGANPRSPAIRDRLEEYLSADGKAA